MDLSQSSDWSLSFEQTLTGSNLSNFLVPVQFTSQIIGVYISTSAAKPTWHRAGWISQLVPTNLISTTVNWIAYNDVTLLGGNVIIFPDNFSSYQLQFSFPVYFPNAFLSIYSYSGTVTTPDTLLGQINSTISDILTLTTNVANIAQQIQNIITIITGIAAILG